MSENHSRIGKPVEKFSMTDEPQERYQTVDPWTGERIKPGLPILTKTPTGNVINKDITHSQVKCPECETPAIYDDDSEPVCPDCGIICAGNGELIHEIVIDAKAAGRIDGEDAS